MADTIENFKSYFHPDKLQNNFHIDSVINKALSLLDINTNNNFIKIIKHEQSNIRINTYEDELIQVLMVLLINAKEALNNSNTIDPYIQIILKDNISSIELVIVDNAGGIEKSIQKQIFNPYFTTKSDNSNGVGLYMAKMIVEGSMQGKLIYTKIDNESHFSIILEGLKDG